MKQLKKINLIALVCIVLDQLIKYMLINKFTLYETKEIIKGFFSITYVQNIGAAFSILEGKTIILCIVAIAVIILLNTYIYKHKISTLEQIFFGILYGGIIGNLIDRIIRGYVIDYLDFNIFGYNFPVFNFADICITISTFIIIILTLKSGEKNEIQSN